jgi:hypothetical protein
VELELSSKPNVQKFKQAVTQGCAFPSSWCVVGRVLSAHAVAVDKVKVGASARVSFQGLQGFGPAARADFFAFATADLFYCD